MNQFLLLSLRFLHIFGGVLWVGAAVAYFFFTQPSVKALGPAGGTFMTVFMEKRRYPIFMAVTSSATILSGFPLFFFASGKFSSAWLSSGPGIGFTVGSVLAIVGYFIGFVMISPRAQRLSKLGQQAGQAGGPPSPELIAQMEQLDHEAHRWEFIEFVLLSLSLLLMATARYMNF
jgi:uncharacterized membrane protein